MGGTVIRIGIAFGAFGAGQALMRDSYLAGWFSATVAAGLLILFGAMAKRMGWDW